MVHERQVAAWAAARHDGYVVGGALPEGYRDNYMAELAAQLHAQLEVARASAVRRVVVVFDAMKSEHEARERGSGAVAVARAATTVYSDSKHSWGTHKRLY